MGTIRFHDSQYHLRIYGFSIKQALTYLLYYRFTEFGVENASILLGRWNSLVLLRIATMGTIRFHDSQYHLRIYGFSIKQALTYLLYYRFTEFGVENASILLGRWNSLVLLRIATMGTIRFHDSQYHLRIYGFSIKQALTYLLYYRFTEFGVENASILLGRWNSLVLLRIATMGTIRFHDSQYHLRLFIDYSVKRSLYITFKSLGSKSNFMSEP
ncbi:hypothetical protein BDF20DRAFT_838026 [Mycotypha africana]|uniref:uncharacterized protein n=1 Tax=Mycotypha africana TaxID=64632 RepID=UPI0023011A8B|nr:uncharacterized protein BDF20DRAFT_838026 [Mycotypha africana]KAI8971725.1 hypothetical protein BDF20DRAFT_838026 [Mycotypha africana]